MKPARLIILSVAVVAAGLAGYLAMSLTGRSPREARPRPDHTEGRQQEGPRRQDQHSRRFAAEARRSGMEGLARRTAWSRAS